MDHGQPLVDLGGVGWGVLIGSAVESARVAAASGGDVKVGCWGVLLGKLTKFTGLCRF